MTLTPISNSVEFVQDSVPTTAVDGDSWLDTSLSPPRLKVFDDAVGAFVEPRSIQNLDAPVSEAGASAEVKRLDLRFVREMSRLFFDRSLSELNFSDGLFEIFADTAGVSLSSDVVVAAGTNGLASVASAFDIGSASATGTTLNTQDATPTGMAFSDDGTTMIEIGSGSELFYEYDGAFSATTGTGTVSRSVSLGFTPSTVVVEDSRENGLTASYDIADGNGNTVTISQSEIGSTVDCSALTDGTLTVTANLDNPNTAPNALRDFAAYFD
jgi:hypothetical protein